MLLSNHKLLVLVSFLFISFVFLFCSEVNGSHELILFVTLFISSAAMYNTRKNLYIFLLSFFIFLFPFDYSIGHFSGFSLYPFYRFENMAMVFFCISVFSSILSSLNVQSPNVIYEHGLSENFEFVSGRLVLWSLMCLSLIMLIAIKGQVSIFSGGDSYSTYQDNLRSGSGVIEYTLMVFLACLFYKKNKTEKTILTVIVFIYIIKTILFGFRVQALVAIIILSVLLLKKYPSSKFNFGICFSGFLIMIVYGVIKEGVSIFDGDIGFNILLDTRYGYVQSHQHGVLSSSSIILAYDNDEISKVLYWPAALITAFLPRRVINDELGFMYPSAYVQFFDYTPGGGFFLVQILSLLGPIGVAVISIFLFYILNSFSSNVNLKGPLLIAAICLLCFFPRWVSYDFLNFGIRTIFIVLGLVYLPCLLRMAKRAY